MAGNTWGESWGIAGAFAWGDSWGFEGFVPPVTPPTPIGGAGGALHRENYLSWWERERARILEERKARKKKKVPKKKRTLLEELDDILLELRARIREDEVPTEVKAEVQRIQTFSNEALNAAITAEQVKLYVSLANAIAQEMDDEETILLALH